MTIIDKILLVVLIAFCVFASLKDVKTRKIPNWIPLSLFLIWLTSVVVKWVLSDAHIIELQVIDVLWNAAKQVITSGLVCCILAACIVFVNKRREKNGLCKTSPFGMGDVKLLMVICLFLGPTLSFVCLFTACIVFLLFILIANIGKTSKIKKAPFAPFILAGVCVASVIAIL